MKKTLILFGLVLIMVLTIGNVSPNTYHFTLYHYFEENGIEISSKLERDEYLLTGTEITVSPLKNYVIEGYEDGIWEVAYVNIDGGNSQIEENYDDVIFWPTKSTTFTLIPDDTEVGYHYIFSANAHVQYEWDNAPASVTLPIDNKGYADGAYTKEAIVIDSTYSQGYIVIENNIQYTFSGWTKQKINNKLYLIKGSWTIEEIVIPQEEIVEPQNTEYIPQPPDTGI